MSDHLIHALAFDERVRIVAAVSTASVQTALDVHDPSPTAAAALGRLLTAAALLNSDAKGHARLSLQLDGQGPFGMLLARAAPSGSVYGTIKNPRVPIAPRSDGKLDVAGGVGRAGQLMVVRELGVGEPYVGAVPIVSGEIGEDVAHYLLQSEQIGSAVGLGVLLSPEARVLGAGGFLIQMLGGVPEEVVDEVEARISAIRELSREIEAGLTPKDLVERLAGDDHRVVGQTSLTYQAPQDREYYRGRIAGLGPDALTELFAGTDTIELTCEFTRETHVFERSDFA